MPRRFKAFIDGMPSFKKDSRFMPLQAADLLACWKREEFEKKGTVVGELGPLMPWEEKEANHGHLYGELNEKALRDIFHQRFGEKYGFTASWIVSGYGLGWEFADGFDP